MYITPTGGIRNPFYTVTQFSVVESFWTFDLKYFLVQNRDPISLNAFKLINNLLTYYCIFSGSSASLCVCVCVFTDRGMDHLCQHLLNVDSAAEKNTCFCQLSLPQNNCVLEK